MATNQSRTNRTVLIVGAVGAITIIAQSRRINHLEKVVRRQRVSIEVAQRSLIKAGTMMSLPHFLGLVDDAITDIKFEHIVKNI